MCGFFFKDNKKRLHTCCSTLQEINYHFSHRTGLCVCACACAGRRLLTVSYAYQSSAEEHRACAVMGHSPGDELLNMVQLATYLYCPLQLVLQTLLEALCNLLQKIKKNKCKHEVLCPYLQKASLVIGLQVNQQTAFDRCRCWDVGLSSCDSLSRASDGIVAVTDSLRVDSWPARWFDGKRK